MPRAACWEVGFRVAKMETFSILHTSTLDLTRVLLISFAACFLFKGVVATTVARSPPFLRRPVFPRVQMEKLNVSNHNTRRPTWAGVGFRNPNKRTPTVMVLIK